MATTRKGSEEQACYEIGDALFYLDGQVEVRVTRFPGVLLVFSDALDPWRAFWEVVANPPAHVERLVPVEEWVPSTLESVVNGVRKIVRRKPLRIDRVRVEVVCRGCRVGGRSKVIAVLREILLEDGVHVTFKGCEYCVKVEVVDTYTALALMRCGWDRVSFWRRVRVKR